jgi:hypothetical protein
MTGTVEAVAYVIAAINLLVAAYGAWVWRQGSPPEDMLRRFWIGLRAAQAGALAFAVFVGVLVIAGHHPSESLFYLYALLPLAVAFIAEQLRIASAQTVLDQLDLPDAQAVGALPETQQLDIVAQIVRREVAVMAASTLVVAFLLARAAGTAHGL